MKFSMTDKKTGLAKTFLLVETEGKAIITDTDGKAIASLNFEAQSNGENNYSNNNYYFNCQIKGGVEVVDHGECCAFVCGEKS